MAVWEEDHATALRRLANTSGERMADAARSALERRWEADDDFEWEN